MNSVTRYRGRRFLIIFATFVAALCALYFSAFKLQARGYAPASWWVKDIYHYKEWLAEQQPSPRILVLGGSGAMFGVDSAVLAESTGLPTVNLSVHGLLSLDFLLEKVKSYVREGDLIVMPLEHYYFFASEQRTLWFINNMLAWGWEGYLDRKSMTETFDFLRAVPPSRIVQGLWGLPRKIPLTDPGQVIAFASQAGPIADWRGYGYKSMTATGEYSVDRPRAEKLVEEIMRGWSYFQKQPTEVFIDKFRELERMATDANATVMLTWPGNVRNHRFDMSNEQHLANVERRFIEPLKKAGIAVHCSPGLFNYDLRFFFDTEYHLNRRGRTLNSATLAICIQEFLRDSPGLSTLEAVRFVKAREKVLVQELESAAYLAPGERLRGILKSVPPVDSDSLKKRQLSIRPDQ